MKKILFLIFLSGIAFKLKAQQKLNNKPFEKKFAPGLPNWYDTTANLRIKPKNDLNTRFLPNKEPLSNNLVASLDKMPIVQPVGKWNMPVVHPNGTVVYTMPIKRLPPVIKQDSSVKQVQP